MNTAQIGATILVAVGLTGCVSVGRKPLTVPPPIPNVRGSLAAQLDALKFIPLPDTPRGLDPGTVLRDSQHVVAWPDEAYEHPERLQPRPTDVSADGEYRDAVNSSGHVDVTLARLLRVLGLRASFGGTNVRWLKSEIRGLEKNTLSELQIEAAELKPQVIAKIGNRANAITVVQGVYSAKVFRVSFEDSHGVLGSTELRALWNDPVTRNALTTAPGMTADVTRKLTSEGQIVYDGKKIGYEPYFRIGGKESRVSTALASDIASLLAENHVGEAQANNTLVTARPTYQQLDLVTSLADHIVAARVAAESLTIEQVKLARATENTQKLEVRNAELVRQVEDQKAEQVRMQTQLAQLRQANQPSEALVRALDRRLDRTDKMVRDLASPEGSKQPIFAVADTGTQIVSSTATCRTIPDDRIVAKFDARLADIATNFAKLPMARADQKDATFEVVVSCLGEAAYTADPRRQPALRRAVVEQFDVMTTYASQRERRDWLDALKAEAGKLSSTDRRPRP